MAVQFSASQQRLKIVTKGGTIGTGQAGRTGNIILGNVNIVPVITIFEVFRPQKQCPTTIQSTDTRPGVDQIITVNDERFFKAGMGAVLGKPFWCCNGSKVITINGRCL